MNEANIVGQSSFDRILYNDKKLGAYFTNQKDALLLRNLFKFPTDSPCCCIDPSCGDGAALGIVTGRAFGNESIVNFGVELDRERYTAAKNNPCMEYVIMADFMQEVKISRDVFSFGYLNPPYGESMMKERYEKIFFKRLDQYLMPGAFLCMVVPYYIFGEDPQLSKVITNRYDILSVFKFREFDQFKQVAVVCRKKAVSQSNLEMAKGFQQYITNINDVFILPDEVPEERKYVIPPSYSENVRFFESEKVDMDILLSIPSHSSMGRYLSDTTKVQEAFGSMGRPPLMPSKSHIYMLATSGYGRGTVGNEKEGDRHLQRGRVIDGVETKQEIDPVTHKVTETIRHFKKTLVTILQNDGTIVKLGN